MAYGSGEPEDYRNYSRYLSSVDTWNSARTWVFGDSLTFAGRAALISRLAAQGETAALDAWSARPMTPAIDELEARLDNPAFTHPEFVAMLVGTNDLFNPVPVAAQVQRARLLCEAHGITLVWMDTFARRVGFEQADLINSAWVNEQIHANIPANRIIRWHRLFAQDKNRINNRLRDGVHTKTTEYDFWAASVMSVLGPLL